jgi:hypothetical protein
VNHLRFWGIVSGSLTPLKHNNIDNKFADAGVAPDVCRPVASIGRGIWGVALASAHLRFPNIVSDPLTISKNVSDSFTISKKRK